MNTKTNIKTALLLCSSLTVMAGATISAALPAMKTSFADVSNAGLYVRLILTLPSIVIAICSPVAGWLTDKFGRRNLLLLSLLLYAIGGTSGIYLTNLSLILIGRFLLGVAVAGVMTATNALISDYFKDGERASFLGLQGAFTSFGGVLFIAAGGALTGINWHAPFWIYILSVPILFLSFLFLKEPVQLLNNGKAKVIAISNINYKQLVLPYAATFLAMLIFYMIPTQAPFLIESGLHKTATIAGLAISLNVLMGALSSLGFGALKRRFSSIALYQIAFGLFAAGYITIAFSNSFFQTLFGLAIAGLGNGIVIPASNAMVMKSSTANQIGKVIGILSFFMFFGQFISPVVVQLLYIHFSLPIIFSFAGYLSLTIVVALFLWKRSEVVSNAAITPVINF